MNKRLVTFYGGLAAAIFALGIGKDFLTYNKSKDPFILYPQVIEKADANKDGDVTEAEWLNIYKFLNKPYDARKPSSLSIEDMRKYLRINE
ncbi:hypothetical protein COU56_01315 [Candidatus Pacearchaeota archaeon CG10_big_fil_rev_8_21_14_0_10_31_9]|nr:MAG: hypothetical protein AUJ62_02770 [Candidatus Pacearchaeota archaeon CG1_02_32_21]PIN95535.1 MAG: hypothetical protein COU56_01315 [Candidatus Pacearchaeota archaeon CG10_big_fil_rev_8_21_14_0_10_31_9]